MNAWLTIDFISKRYGVLPTKAIQEGGTLDIFVANLGVEYENWLHKKHEAGHESKTPSTEQMQGMLERVRARRNDSKA